MLLPPPRGESERNFNMQNNDFHCAHKPFSDMKDNTVILLIIAMLSMFWEKLRFMKNTSRLKSFIFYFINGPAK